jgi:hypothetical protein
MPIIRKEKPKTETKPPAAEAKRMKDVPEALPRLADSEKRELVREAANATVKLLEAKGLLGKPKDAKADEKVTALEKRLKDLEEKPAPEPVAADTSALEEKVTTLQSVVQTIQESLTESVKLFQSKLPSIDSAAELVNEFGESVKNLPKLSDLDSAVEFVKEFGEPIQTLVEDLMVQRVLILSNEDERFSKLSQLTKDLGMDRLKASFERIAKTSTDDVLRERAKECLGQ